MELKRLLLSKRAADFELQARPTQRQEAGYIDRCENLSRTI